MFLQVEQFIINLEQATSIYVNEPSQGRWTVNIEAGKDHIIFLKDFSKLEEAEAFLNKFILVLNPKKIA